MQCVVRLVLSVLHSSASTIPYELFVPPMSAVNRGAISMNGDSGITLLQCFLVNGVGSCGKICAYFAAAFPTLARGRLTDRRADRRGAPCFTRCSWDYPLIQKLRRCLSPPLDIPPMAVTSPYSTARYGPLIPQELLVLEKRRRRSCPDIIVLLLLWFLHACNAVLFSLYHTP